MLTQDDIIYFVVTDRFRNGDVGNDRSPPQVDRSHPGRFHGGDFPGLVEGLPYLKKLGVTAVWITPVYLSIGRFFDSDGYHGYWALDFSSVDPILHPSGGPHPSGSRKYLADLVQSVHQQGMKLVLDVVVNHTGYHNETYQSFPNKLPESFFNQNGTSVVDQELSGLPDLDHDRSDVVDFFIENLLDWIEATGVDALRMDTVKHVEDKFWHFFKANVKGAHREVTLLGEVFSTSVAEVARYQTQNDFETLFDFPLRQALLDVFVHDQSPRRLAKPRIGAGEPRGILDEDNPGTGGYSNANRLVTLIDNHDVDRRIMSEARLRHPGPDPTAAKGVVKLCLSFLMTTRGIPKLYYGTELAMEGYKEGNQDHRMREDFPWNSVGDDLRPIAGTLARELYDHTRRLIEIRRSHPALRYGSLLTAYVDDFIYAFVRYQRNDFALVVINNGLQPMPVPLPIPIAANSNIPSRVKALIAGSQLIDLLDSAFTTSAAAGAVPVQLAGKACRILTPAR